MQLHSTTRRKFLATLAAAALLLASPAGAQVKSPAPAPQPSVILAQEKPSGPVQLKLHPAAVPTPALKYALLPPLHDCQPGNAAIFYNRAHSPDLIRALDRLPFAAKMHEYLSQPMSGAADQEARQLLGFTQLFKELDHAARCESCDWQMSDRLRDEGVALMLPEVQTFRVMGQMLAVKARLEAHDGQHAAAVRTLQTSFALGRHVSECPIVINALVGMAISQMTLDAVEDLVQQPTAPNLYWALRDLPEPLIDLRRPLQGDRLAVDAWWPEIRKALSASKFEPLPLHVLRANITKVNDYMRGDTRLELGTVIAFAQPAAMAYFEAQGHSRAELEALPVTQVVLMHALTQWDRWYDEIYRWHNVPYAQARTALKKATDERERQVRSNKINMVFIQHMLPAHESAMLQRARLQRRFAALQCVEALRLYAAAHNGNLPDALGDIRAVPIPLDPLTGNAFEYASDGNTARLSASPPPGETANERNTLAYQITMQKRGQ